MGDEDTLRYESYRENNAKQVLMAEPGASELGLLRSYFRRVIEAWGNPIAKDILNTYQLLNSCGDIPTLMAMMAKIETDLHKLSSIDNKDTQTENGPAREKVTLPLDYGHHEGAVTPEKEV